MAPVLQSVQWVLAPSTLTHRRFSRCAGVEPVQLIEHRALRGAFGDQLFQITEKADPVTAGGGGVVVSDFSGDAAEQIAAGLGWIVFEELGEVGGVLASLRSQKLRFHGRSGWLCLGQ